MSITAVLAVVGLAASFALIGAVLPAGLRGASGPAVAAVRAAMLGMLVVFAALLLMTGLGLRWSRGSILVALLLATALAVLLRRRFGRPRETGDGKRTVAWGWGDSCAAAVLVVFACFALGLAATTPDFIYHWGLKAERFMHAGGIDFHELGQRWNWPIHPDYPNLVPSLSAAAALLAGRFDEPAQMMWSVLSFAALLIAVRDGLLAGQLSRGTFAAALAMVALVTGGFAIGSEMAGGADWLVALALAAAVAALVAAPSGTGDRQIAVCAALAAAAKVEGVALAAGLLAVQGLRTGRPGWTLRRAATLALPTLALTVPWQLAVHRFHLFQQFNTGGLDLTRWPRILPALATSLSAEAWHGFAWTLLLVPLMFFRRSLRPLATVIVLQLAFDLYVYLSVGIEPVPLILASFPRLVFQLLPTVLVGLVVALGGEPSPRVVRPAGEPA